MLEVLEPGLLSTVQDGGRPGLADQGVPRSGACDPTGLAVANLLLGNAPDAAALEMTLQGPELKAVEEVVVGLGGADLGATVDGERFPAGSSRLLQAGALVRLGAAESGTRGYLAMAGGIDVPRVLGSASTCLAGGFGGLEGRALRGGDRLIPVLRGRATGAGRAWPSGGAAGVGPARERLRVLPGPHAAAFRPGSWEALLTSVWEVHPRSDRTGLRLAPAGRQEAPDEAEQGGRTEGIRLTAGATALPSQPMTWGAVQVSADDQLMVLLADHQTIGGYPVLAVVISADRGALGQLAPGRSVHFVPTSIEEAQKALRAQQAQLRRIGDQLARGW